MTEVNLKLSQSCADCTAVFVLSLLKKQKVLNIEFLTLLEGKKKQDISSDN
jgi:hypothetical protein